MNCSFVFISWVLWPHFWDFCSSDLCYSFISHITFKCLSVSFETEGYSFDLFVGIFLSWKAYYSALYSYFFLMVILCGIWPQYFLHAFIYMKYFPEILEKSCVQVKIDFLTSKSSLFCGFVSYWKNSTWLSEVCWLCYSSPIYSTFFLHLYFPYPAQL